jgi:hypothetical protein
MSFPIITKVRQWIKSWDKIIIMFGVEEIPLNKQRLVISDLVVLDFGYIICFMNKHMY